MGLPAPSRTRVSFLGRGDRRLHDAERTVRAPVLGPRPHVPHRLPAQDSIWTLYCMNR